MSQVYSGVLSCGCVGMKGVLGHMLSHSALLMNMIT